MQIPKELLVYVDESGIDDFLIKTHGWAVKGQKIWGEISGKHFDRESFVAGKCGQSILAPLCFKGTCNTELFTMWVKDFLVKELKPGQVVIMDNASFHKSPRIRTLIEAAGCSLIYLPPYSPDLNPIEHFWAWLKQKIRDTSHLFSSLQDAIDFAFSYTPKLN